MKMNGVISKTATNFMGTNIGGMFKYNPSDASHVLRWLTAAAETNLWVQGFWRVPWESEGERVLLIDTASNTLATASGATPGSTGFGNKYSAADGSYNEPYWVLNLLEEMDQPGEWAIDFYRNKLYFLPPGPVTNGAVVISDFASPVIQLTGGSNVVFSGLTLDISLTQGIVITNAVDNLVLGCSFRNLGSYAVDLSYGRSNGVVSCDMTQLAAGGILVQGGTETTPRVSCDHFVVNNDITDFAQVVPVYAAGVDAGFGGMAGGGGGGGHKVSVGARIAHNRIKGTPHGPIIRGSFDKVFEYNWIEEYTTISGDFGGIYSYQSTNQGGFDAIRYNYFYCPTNYLYPTYLNPGPTGGVGIQVDNTWTGDQIYGNIATGRRSGYGAGTGGGSGAAFYNNLTVNCGQGGISWSGLPAVYATNVAALGSIAITGDQTGSNFAYATDPGFVSWSNRDVRLDPGCSVYSDQPGFREIPFEMIGLYNDEIRTNVSPPAPVIRNLAATTGATTNGATLNAELIFPWFSPDTTVRVFWGPADGGTNAANWTNCVYLGVRTRSMLSTNVSGLLPATTCFYRFQASNSAAVVWATNSTAFVMPNPRYQTTIGFPGYTRSEVLTNIPLLVALSTNIPDFSYANFTSPTGGDLRFKTADGLTDLSFEIESWNTNGTSLVWVRVPALNAATSILARWGDPLATNLQASSSDGSTWNKGYVGVWHLNAATVTDSSPLPQNASGSTAAAAPGIVAGGLSYNGNSQTTTLPPNGKFNLASNFELQGWFKVNPADKPASNDYRTLTAKEIDANNRNWWIAMRDNGTLWWRSSPNLDLTNLTDLANNQWHHFAAIHDGSVARLYVDGLPAATDTSPGNADTQISSVYFGSEWGTASYFKGSLDELRLSNQKRSSNWVWAIYQNIASNSAFLGYTAITNLLPTAPANLTASSADGHAVLNWSTSAGAESYNLKRSTTNGGPYTVIANLSGLSFTNAGLVNGVTYYYVVAGMNSRGEGDNSPQASAIPLANSVKANNALDLDLPGSWLNNAVPTGLLATWDGTVSTAGTSAIGSGVSFAGVQISNPGTNVVINPGAGGTLALGPSGLDLSTCAKTLALNSTIALGTKQVWKTGGYSTPGAVQLTATNVISGPGGIALDPANTRAVALNGSNSFTGGFSIAGSAVLDYSAASVFAATGGVVSSSPIGSGPLTIYGGTLRAGDRAFFNPAVGIKGDFTWSTTGRDDTSGVFDLDGATRTIMLTRAVSPANVVISGGNNSIRFTTLSGGIAANIFTNGALRLAAASSVAPGNFVVATFSTANGNAFRGNGELIVGPQVYVSPSFTGGPFGAAATDRPAVAVEAGGFWSVSDGGTGRGHTIFSLAGAGTVLNNTSGTAARTDTLTIDGGAKTNTYTFAGVIRDIDLTTFPSANSNLIFALTKAGSTTQILAGNNSLTGATAVNGGTLIINGDQSSATGPVAVAAGATLGGTGVLGGSVTVGIGATLWPGASPGALTILSNLSLAGKVVLAVARNGATLTNDRIVVARALTCGGTLIVTNIGATPLQVGDSFQLFTAGTRLGAFTNFVFPPGYAFTNTLALNGRIAVLTGLPNTAPTLAELPYYSLRGGQWLYVTNSASDLESPPQILTYSLLSAPTNATISPAAGIIAWRAPVAAAGTVETFVVTVADNGTPRLGSTQSFQVAVAALASQPTLWQPAWQAGSFTMQIAGDTGPDYTIQVSTNLTAWSNVFTTNSPLTPFYWSDPNGSGSAERFYRLLLSP